MKKYVRFVSVILIVCLLLAVPVSAETVGQARGSAFFAIHEATIHRTAMTTFEVWYDVTATRTMEKLGVSSIEVDESPDGVNWTVIRTYDMKDYPKFIEENTVSYTGHIAVGSAKLGYYYRAYITFYAKNSSGTAELFRYTNTIQM